MKNAEEVAKIIEKYKKKVASGKMTLSEAAFSAARECVGWPYVFGAWGAECTPAERRKRYRADHPTIKSSCKNFDGDGSCSGCKWFPDGKRTRCFDCRGFTDYILRQFGFDLYGEGATSQWNYAGNWRAQGTIDTIPDGVLVCLFYPVKDNPKKMAHTGFGYLGETCECSSGVQYFAVRNKKWTHWAVPKCIEGDIPDVKPTIGKGSKGQYVTLAQTMLLQKGYDLGKWGVDGSFGSATEKAVKEFQQDHGLAVTGVVNQETWKALEEPGTNLYTVTIPHLTKFKAESLVKDYTGASMTEERG